MCHNESRLTTSCNMGILHSQSKNLHQNQRKSVFRLNSFRSVAKTARINLNRYWGLLSRIHVSRPEKDNIEIMYGAEMEQNRINELLEAQALASSQNSVNSQWEVNRFHHTSSSSSPISFQYYYSQSSPHSSHDSLF